MSDATRPCPNCHTPLPVEAQFCLACGVATPPPGAGGQGEERAASVYGVLPPDQFARLREAVADRYAIEQEAGTGGMAFVFRARDKKHGRAVALKVLRPELAATLGPERFLREIEIAARLQHPHILPLYDSNEAAGFLYYVMPYVEGESLRDRLLRERELPVALAVRILREVTDALAYAHHHGVVHRDIKPDNVLLSDRHAMVTDFGVAKALRQAVTSSGLTSAGVSLGTPAYMAPEQAAADPHVDHRADLFAVGVMAYEMLTGRLPFAGDSPAAMLSSRVTDDPEPVTRHRPNLPPPIAHLVMKCLQRKPADRWQRADEMLEQFEALGTPSMGTTPVAAVTPAPARGARKHVVPAAVAAVIVAVLVSVGVLAVRGSGGAGANVVAKKVAVVPFTAVGVDATDQAFADGLVEVLTSKLTELEQFAESPLWVVPSSELRERDVMSAGRAREEFDVSLAVTGSVQRAQDELRLTLNLVDAETLRQLRSSVIASPMSRLGSLHDNVVRRLLEMMAVELEPQAERLLAADEVGTETSRAYELYLLGRGYLRRYDDRQKNVDAAIGLFEQAAAEDSLYPLAYAGLGEAYWAKFGETGDTSWVAPAMAQSRRAVMLSDSLAEVWVTLAIISHGVGEDEEAIGHARRALQIDPYNTEAYVTLGRSYQGLDRDDEAEATYQRLIELKPYYWRSYSSLGYLRYVQGRYDEAAASYRQAAQLAPGNATMYNYAGAIYFFLDLWPDAREMFERALEIEVNAGALSNLATLDYYEGDFAGAARRYSQAADIMDTDYLYWRNLADAYRQLPEEADNAHAAFTRCAALAEAARGVNPADADAIDNLAVCYTGLDRRAEALALVEELITLAGDNPELLFSVAEDLEVLGDRDRAVEWLTRALEAGYSLKIVETDPLLAGLRRDPRFRAAADAARARR